MTWEGLTPPYSTIIVDPPWPYEGRISPPVPAGFRNNPNGYVGGGLPYSSMSLDAIRALPVQALSDDARLYLWVTNRFLRHAWGVVEAWGFTPQTRTLVWCKKPMATNGITTEFVIIGKRGKPAKMPWHATTWFDWDRPKRTHHSRKPEAFLDLVESWSPGPYVELFARAPRLGWDHWGYGYEGAA